MAVRLEELEAPLAPLEGARIYRFPVEAVRRTRADLRREAIHRRRAVARKRGAVALLIVVMSTMMLFAGGPQSVAPAAGDRTPRAVVIEPGQTLWALAERYAGPGIDPRAYVDAILVLNDLSEPPQAGARIRLPR